MNPLRPLGLGELIDRSINFWRAHWKPLFQLLLAFQLVEGIVLAGAQGVGRAFFPLASDPAAIADTYMHTLKQPRSAWSLEVELRPWVERF